MRRLRGCWRLLRVLGHVLAGLWIVAVRLPRLPQAQQDSRVQAWAVELLSHLGITLQVLGQPPLTGPVLLVANHVSWLDIAVMHAARHCRFVSKADVQDWPLVGTLATAAGTLYIERSSRRDAVRMVTLMEEALRDNQVLAVFPEGTTGDGRSLLPFHANLLQAAVCADAPAQPVGLRFVDKASGLVSHAPSYVGDETLIGSLWRTVCAPPIVAVVHYGQPERAQGRERRAWIQHLRQSVDSLRQS
jgi:1-acyl-sn-glycerol-3-phosphate acyltransferase